ncbi:MAG: MazG family protein, partial [Candidatus Limnocylindrales bacterium]
MDELLLDAERRHGIRAADGLQIVGLGRLATRPFDPAMALLILPVGAAQDPGSGFDPPSLPGRSARGSDPVTLLRRLYPADHPVLGFGDESDTTLAEIDTIALPVLLPALEWQAAITSPHALPWLAARLRAADGCPWDREQDHRTLRRFLIEETYEVYDALEHGSTPQLAEELGDLLLQIVLHAQYGAEAGTFDLTDVYAGIMAKIVRRHPHVFGDIEAATTQDVVRNWESIKATERADAAGVAKPDDPDMPAAFAGLSRSLPSLAYADEMQQRAAGLGYDWPDLAGVIDKIEE